MNILTRHQLEIYDPDTRDYKDWHKKIARAVFSYFDKNGIECHKSFTAPQNTPECNFWHIAPKTMSI